MSVGKRCARRQLELVAKWPSPRSRTINVWTDTKTNIHSQNHINLTTTPSAPQAAKAKGRRDVSQKLDGLAPWTAGLYGSGFNQGSE
jgi:hypothetical protein